MDNQDVMDTPPEEQKNQKPERRFLLSPVGKNPKEPKRNALCPCNSGKKWKRCHGVALAMLRQRVIAEGK